MTSADVDQALIEAPAQILRREISDLLRHHSANLPRSQQQAIGPSEMGHPCPRRVAQQAIRAPQCNRHAGDPLPSLVGTAAHSLMEDALRTYNERHGERYLIERKVYPIENLGGTMDCFDLETGTVIDWKFPGATSLTRVRRSGDPGEQYRAQAHLYGLGAVRAGFKVNAVAVMFFPRGGMLGGHNGAHVWHEDYDEQHAIDVIERYHSLILMTDDLDIDHHPERLALLPKTPHMCEYCPFYSPTPQDPYQCQGDTK